MTYNINAFVLSVVLYCKVFILMIGEFVSRKKGVLKNFTKFAGKHLCQSLVFNNVTGLRPATLLKRDFGRGVFM